MEINKIKEDLLNNKRVTQVAENNCLESFLLYICPIIEDKITDQIDIYNSEEILWFEKYLNTPKGKIDQWHKKVYGKTKRIQRHSTQNPLNREIGEFIWNEVRNLLTSV